MTAYATSPDEQNDRYGSGLAGAIVLHALLFAGIIGWAIYQHTHTDRWGENASTTGAIEASMVSAIPLPSKVPPVKDNVLTPDTPSIAPTPPPKEATQPPPKDTDVLVKANTPKPITKTASIPTPTPPKHAQPTPDTAKATTGEQATQIPESISQVPNGTSSITVQNRTFGARYAYYLEGVGRTIAHNWFTQEADPRSSIGKHARIIFDIQQDGTPANIRIETPSGSTTLDASALHALQRVEGFGPLPAGNRITVEDTFDYHQ